MALTFFIAQLFGLLILVLSVSMFFHKKLMLEILDDFIRDKALLYTGGILSLSAGLILVLSHNIWSGGWLPVVVTLLGWTMLLRGVLAVNLSSKTYEKLYHSFDMERYYYHTSALMLVLALYLTFAGFYQ